MADKTTQRALRSVVGNEAAVREATRAVNEARRRVGDSAETSTRVLASQAGELNDRLARASWDATDIWLKRTSETWTTGARLTLAWLDLCWQLGWDTWTLALEQQARISRDQIDLWTRWVHTAVGEDETTRRRS